MSRKKGPPHAVRDYNVARIKELLEQGPASRTEICAQLGLNYSTASLYLGYMHKTLHIIHRGPIGCATGFKWQMGAEDVVVETGTRRVVRAKQIGMSRDALVAALFGPANRMVT